MRAKTTEAPAETALLSRRRLLGGTVLAGGAAALTACAPDPSDSVAPLTVPVARVDEVPVDDADAEAWEWGSEVEVVMDAQKIALPNRQTPYRDSIKVRAIHDGTMIGFRLSWEDGDPDADTVTVDGFRDACAVLFAPGEGDSALRVMGSADQPAILVHWKADWQHDIDNGIRTMAQMFPNGTVDTYPPLGAEHLSSEVTPATYVEAGATQWLPGMHVGNPLSAQERTQPVEKLVARSFGNVTPTATQDAVGHGRRMEGGWKVVIAKPLAASDPDEVDLATGQTFTAAFAIWSGGDDDAGGRKTPSRDAFRLELRP